MALAMVANLQRRGNPGELVELEGLFEETMSRGAALAHLA